jgi:hypothetical protein
MDQGVPRAPAREPVDDDDQHADPVTSEALAPLLHKGSPRNQMTVLTQRSREVKNLSRN